MPTVAPVPALNRIANRSGPGDSAPPGLAPQSFAKTRGRPDVLLIIGTRPEAIKLAPVYVQARRRLGSGCVASMCTGQHPEAVRQALADFDMEPDVVLPSCADTDLGARSAHFLSQIAQAFDVLRPRRLVVQGDTTSALAGALAGFHASIPVVHVEAGLRTHDLQRPFPEEGNRQMIARVATRHFAPTRRAVENLLREGIDDQAIEQVGNTVVDAIDLVRDRSKSRWPAPGTDVRRIVVTLHRRESWGGPIASICGALSDVLGARPDVEIVMPLHANPSVQATVRAAVGGCPRVQLVEPQGFADMQALLSTAYLLVTDSGGLQEEAPSHRVPTLVARSVTERQEAVEAGYAVLIGLDGRRAAGEVGRLLDHDDVYLAMRADRNPFGDGRAAERIVASMLRLEADAA